MKAFPWLEKLDSTDPTVINPVSHSGMDLRDYFAAKAMQGLIEALVTDESVIAYTHITDMSYKVADEMMKVREL